jgi:hypothetical protein
LRDFAWSVLPAHIAMNGLERYQQSTVLLKFNKPPPKLNVLVTTFLTGKIVGVSKRFFEMGNTF